MCDECNEAERIFLNENAIKERAATKCELNKH